jgi:hypothetical protein
MGMRVNQTGDDPPAFNIHLAGFFGELERRSWPYELDCSLTDDNSGILQRRAAGAVNEGGSKESDTIGG